MATVSDLHVPVCGEVPLDSLGDILTDALSFLQPNDQSSLRQCGRPFAQWFDTAVARYRMIPFFSPSLHAQREDPMDNAAWKWCPCDPLHYPSSETVPTGERLSEWSEHTVMGTGVLGINRPLQPRTAAAADGGSSRCDDNTASSYFLSGGNKANVPAHVHINLDALCLSTFSTHATNAPNHTLVKLIGRSAAAVVSPEPISTSADDGAGNDNGGDLQATDYVAAAVEEDADAYYFNNNAFIDSTPPHFLAGLSDGGGGAAAPIFILSSTRLLALGDHFLAGSGVSRVVFSNDALTDDDVVGLNGATAADEATTSQKNEETISQQNASAHRPFAVRRIGNGFLANCIRMYSVTDFDSHFTFVETIGDDCLVNCSALTGISFTGMPHLKSIGNFLLSGGTNLRWAHFANLPSLETVGNGWLASCHGLQRAYCKPLPSSSSFPSSSTSEKEGKKRIVDSADANGKEPTRDRIQSLAAHYQQQVFFNESSTSQTRLLRDAAIFDLPSLHTVGGDWMSRCNQLEHVFLCCWQPDGGVKQPPSFTDIISPAWKERQSDRGGLGSLYNVGSRWLADSGTPSQETFFALPCLRMVGTFWLSGCNANAIHFVDLPSVADVPCDWMYRCKHLTRVCFGDADDDVALAVEGNALSSNKAAPAAAAGPPPPPSSSASSSDCDGDDGANAVPSSAAAEAIMITLRGMPFLQTVGQRWLDSCLVLESIRFNSLNSLTSVFSSWMASCARLRSIDFRGLTALANVGNKWLQCCESLTDINFVGLSSLQTVSSDWLSLCPALTNVDFSALVNLTRVGSYWMQGSFYRSLKLISTPQGVGDATASAKDASVNFNGLASLASIGESFMASGGRRLTRVDLTGLSRVTSIDRFMFRHCAYLKEIVISAPPLRQEATADGAGDDVASPQSIFAHPPALSLLTAVPEKCFVNCGALTRVAEDYLNNSHVQWNVHQDMPDQAKVKETTTKSSKVTAGVGVRGGGQRKLIASFGPSAGNGGIGFGRRIMASIFPSSSRSHYVNVGNGVIHQDYYYTEESTKTSKHKAEDEDEDDEAYYRRIYGSNDGDGETSNATASSSCPSTDAKQQNGRDGMPENATTNVTPNYLRWSAADRERHKIICALREAAFEAARNAIPVDD